MTRLLEATLWVESTAYAARLLADDRVPWLDVAGVVGWQRRAQGLLRSDVVTLPVAPICAAWLAAHPALGKAMAGKSRVGFALKTLLAETALRAHVGEVVRGLRASLPGAALALRVPSPQAWTAIAYRQAHGADIDIGDDDADAAAVTIGDFLRGFGDCGVDVLVVEGEPPDATIRNIAGFYRWDVAVARGAELAVDGVDVTYLEIAADAQPEAVLDQLATLRRR